MNKIAIQKPNIPENLQTADFHDAVTQDDVISMHLFEDCTICGEDIERLCVEKRYLEMSSLSMCLFGILN